MGKKQKLKPNYKRKILEIGIAGVVISLITYAAIISMIPVNVSYPVFEPPENFFLKAIKQNGKYVFASQSAKGGKGIPSSGMPNPSLHISEGNLVSIHLINEQKNTIDEKSLHNINIDRFNVHSNDLGYFQTQTITFLANEKGEFTYYCTIHPQMKGKIVVE